MTFKEELDECDGGKDFFRAFASGLVGAGLMGVILYLSDTDNSKDKEQKTVVEKKKKKKI